MFLYKNIFYAKFSSMKHINNCTYSMTWTIYNTFTTFTSGNRVYLNKHVACTTSDKHYQVEGILDDTPTADDDDDDADRRVLSGVERSMPSVVVRATATTAYVSKRKSIKSGV